MSTDTDTILKVELQIAKLQDQLRAWKDIGLPEKTMVILLSHSTKVPQKTIRKIFDGIDNLHADYFDEST